MKKILLSTVLISVSLLSGCFSTKINYNKIPLADNQEPFILAPGDYIDTKGFLHKSVTNGWVMCEKDIYDYVRWLKNNKYAK